MHHLVMQGAGRHVRHVHQEALGGEAAVGHAAQLGKHRDVTAVQHGLRLRCWVAHGQLRRPTEQKALAERDAEVAHHLQVLSRLQPFGDHRRAEDLGDVHQRAQRLQLVAMRGDVAREVLVDLHQIRLELGPQAQAGAAVAEVVQRDAHPRAAHGLGGVQQALDVAHLLMLGELEHDGRRRQSVPAQPGEHVVAFVEGLHQRTRTDVDEQLARCRELGPAPQRRARARDLQVDLQPLGASSGEQRVRHVQRAALRAADQRFVGMHARRAEPHDGLEPRA
jgi:hypothetical protein